MTDNNEQLGLFDMDSAAARSVRAHRQAPPLRARTRSRGYAGMTPAVAQDVLAEVADHRYGIDDNTRIVTFIEDDRVRLAADDDIVWSLIWAGCIDRSREDRDCYHGAIQRTVSPLHLTRRGRALLHRWSAYTPLGRTSRD